MEKYTYLASLSCTPETIREKTDGLSGAGTSCPAALASIFAAIALIAIITFIVLPVEATAGDVDDKQGSTYFEKPLLMFAPSGILADVRERSLMEEEEQAGDGTTVGVQGGRYGVGFASSWPSYGLSGTLLISETLTGEVILGFLGAITNVGARGWYRFNTNHNYDIYAYGGLSLLMYRYDTFDPSTSSTRKKTETVPGIGAGVGMEFSLQQLLEDESFPPLFFSIELGLAIASFEFYDFSFLSFGAGIRYRFGDR
jgi:hypothetical protein